MKKRKIMIIAHFCDYGEENSNNRFNYIAQLLHENNMEVELVTSSFSHRDKKQRKENKCRDYKVTLIYEPSYNKNVSLKRLFYSHNMMSRNLKKYLCECEKPDLIYCAVPSLDVPYIAGKYAKKNKIPFVLDIQDLWPEAFEMAFDIPVISSLLFRPIKSKADKVYALADEIVGVSKTYVNRGLNGKEAAQGMSVYLGTDLQQFDEARGAINIEKKQDEKWIAYVGTLGHSYNIPLVIDALSKLKERGYENVKFKVLGDGPLSEKFKKYAREKQVDVDFLGKRSYPEMISYLCKADIAINPIVKGAPGSIINKHGDYAAAGLAIINTQESPEYRKLLEEYSCGINCGVESVDDVERAVEELLKNEILRAQMGANSRKLAEEKFNRAVTYKEIIYLLNKV